MLLQKIAILAQASYSCSSGLADICCCRKPSSRCCLPPKMLSEQDAVRLAKEGQR